MMNYNECEFITKFRGEFAADYPTHLEYVKSGMWEKDYFAHWLLEKSDADCYPTLDEIIDFSTKLKNDIENWLESKEK